MCVCTDMLMVLCFVPLCLCLSRASGNFISRRRYNSVLQCSLVEGNLQCVAAQKQQSAWVRSYRVYLPGSAEGGCVEMRGDRWAVEGACGRNFLLPLFVCVALLGAASRAQKGANVVDMAVKGWSRCRCRWKRDDGSTVAAAAEKTWARRKQRR